MRIRHFCLLLLALAGMAHGAELGVLAPLMQDDAPITRPAPGESRPAPVVKRLRAGKLYDAIQHEAAGGFTAAMLALDELAMRVAGDKPGPTWLLLSQEEGGFARRGFWLREGDALRWVDERMVDLVVDAASVDDGSFEEIFAHELGHVMLRRLVPNLPDGYSRTPHHSFTVTDQQTAFDEGWATHFQGLARNLTLNPRLRAHDAGLEGKPFVPLWLSNVDREARIDGMRRNRFVHRQAPMDGEGDPVALHDLSPRFHPDQLKSAAQMLASEGVVATFFYRQLASGMHHAARAACRAEPLRGQGTIPDQLIEKCALTPVLEVRDGYQPMFAALHALSADRLTPQTPLVPALARKLAAVSPEQGRRFIRVLMETSNGALVSPELAAAAEGLAAAGRFGDAGAFVPALKALRTRFAAVLADVDAHPERLAELAGPAIWLMHPARKVDGKPMFIDLNTAERAHLLVLPGVDAAAAERALASRRRQGNFRDLQDFVARAGLGAATASQLQKMAQAAIQAGPLRRE